MRIVHRLLITAVVLAGALALAGCGRHAPLSPATTVATGAHAAAAVSVAGGVQHVQGETGPGSTYSIDVPAEWNGDLVIYAHGITLPPWAPVGLPGGSFLKLRDVVLPRGFALAASSFDVNGYCVKDGVQRTHQLVELFAERFGAPKRIYLVGISLGGIIVEDMAESFPTQFAGVLSGAGVMGGTLEELDYVANVRVLFDLFFPDTLPGTLYDVPPMTPAQYGALQGKIVATLSGHPQQTGMIAALEPRLAYRSGAELVESITSTLMFQLMGANDLTDRAHGHGFFDNHDRVYVSSHVPQPMLDWVNAHIGRFTATPDAVNAMKKYYTPTGDLRVKMVTFHNQWDPVVPYVHETLYGALVAASGHSDNLRQHAIANYGHDNFDTSAIAGYFDELVAWTTGAPVEWTP